MAWIIFLSALPDPVTACLISLGVNSSTARPARLAAQIAAPRACPRSNVLAGGNCRQMCLDDRFDFAGDMRQSRCSLTLGDVKDARRNPNGFGARRVNDAPAGVIETGVESENAHCGSHALPKPSVG